MMISKTDSFGSGQVGGKVAAAARQWLEPRQDAMKRLLGDLVCIESASDDPVGLAEMGNGLVRLVGELGHVERHPAGFGAVNNLVLTVEGAERAWPHVLALGHYDTVWRRGTLARIPFAVDDRGVATGPGCFDMKGGLVVLYYALLALSEAGLRPRRTLRVVLNCDEEIGSRTSRELIRATATNAAAALVLEAPLPGGVLKTARKGTATYRLRIEGRAAHAGIEPERGVSANLELAHQVRNLYRLNDAVRGTSVNVGLVQGGTRSNVVSACAEAVIDVRTKTTAEADRVRQAINALEPVVPGARLSVIADLSRPPMERTPAGGRLFAQAKAIAAEMGVPDLEEGSTGGGSDGNLVAAMGIATLDGLGPEGGGAHAEDEHVLLASLPSRAALIAGLLADI